MMAVLYRTLHSANSADEPGSVVTLATVGMENLLFALIEHKASREGSLSNTTKRDTDHKLQLGL